MGATPSPELVGKTIMWFMMIPLTTIVVLTAIAYFSYKHNEEFYGNVRLGHVYVFDALSKYKKTILYAMVFLSLVIIGLQVR
jgi:hypothetical protein